MTRLLYYIAVGHLVKTSSGTYDNEKHSILSSRAPEPSDEKQLHNFESSFLQIMKKGSQKLKLGSLVRLSLDTPDGSNLHVRLLTESYQDKIFVFYAVTSINFAQIHDHNRLFQELKSSFYAQNEAVLSNPSSTVINKRSQQVLLFILTKFNASKLEEVRARLDEVKSVMEDNVQKCLNNLEQLEVLQQKAEELDMAANDFGMRATVLKKKMRCANIRNTLILVGLIIAILLVIIVPIVVVAKK